MSSSETTGKQFFSDPHTVRPCFIELPNEAEALGDVISDKPKVRTHFLRTSGSRLLDEITYASVMLHMSRHYFHFWTPQSITQLFLWNALGLKDTKCWFNCNCLKFVGRVYNGLSHYQGSQLSSRDGFREWATWARVHGGKFWFLQYHFSLEIYRNWCYFPCYKGKIGNILNDYNWQPL